jgi:hypothetical protein
MKLFRMYFIRIPLNSTPFEILTAVSTISKYEEVFCGVMPLSALLKGKKGKAIPVTGRGGP